MQYVLTFLCSKECFTIVVQNLFLALLQISKEKVLKACLKLTNVFDLSGRASFQTGIRIVLHRY